MPALKSPKPNLKSRAMMLVRALPKNSSWDDLMYRIYVRQKIEAGLADIRAGRVHSHASIRREFGLAP
jgi:predicted transcriptional regulator